MNYAFLISAPGPACDCEPIIFCNSYRPSQKPLCVMSHDSAMKQITGYQARGPGLDSHSRHTKVISGS